MEKRESFCLFLLLYVLLCSSLLAQNKFTVYPCKNIKDAITVIDTVLLKSLKEKGLVSNISFKGDPESIGRFVYGDSIGFSRGIVLSTGYVKDVVGPNLSSNTGGKSDTKGIMDEDCNILSGEITNDAVVVEFDFVPVGDFIQFEYLWASEEYNKYVPKKGSDKVYNDVFGFFVSGQGIKGGFSYSSENIAKIPNTDKDVGIRNIHCGMQENFRLPPPMVGPNCELLKWNNHFQDNKDGGSFCEFNAYTVPFKAFKKVERCQKYHLKMALADAKDSSWDSGVFLKAESFFLGNVVVIPEVTNKKIDNDVIFNCNEVALKFQLPFPAKSDYKIPIFYGGDAEVGYDVEKDNMIYCLDTIIIPANKTEAKTIVKAKNNEFIKEKKELQVIYQTPLCGNSQRDTVWVDIKRNTPLKVIHSNDTIFSDCKEEIICKAEVSGGHNPINIVWDFFGEKKNTNTISFTAQKSGSIILTVEDVCFNNYRDTTYLKLDDLFLEMYPNISEACYGDEICFEIQTNGIDSKWNNGFEGKKNTIKIISDTIVSCHVKNKCDEWISKSMKIKVIKEPKIDAGEDVEICEGESILLKGIGGENVAWYLDNQELSLNHDFFFTPLNSCSLIFTANDKCIQYDTLNIKVKPNLIVEIDENIIEHCIPAKIKLASRQSKDIAYNCRWFVENELLSTSYVFEGVFYEEGEYSFKLIADSDGYCSDTIDLSDLIELSVPPEVEIYCDNESFYKGGEYTFSALPELNNVDYQWSVDKIVLGKGAKYNHFFKSKENVKLMLIASNNYGCSTKDSLIVEVENSEDYIFIPNAFSPNGDHINDVFSIESNGIKSVECRIFNRWGRQVFYSEELDFSWDGSFCSKKLAPGEFVVKINIITNSNRARSYTKLILLLK
ncbi:MAG: choice-of-anchor L domain-containing protein [Bacteroidales bacterium]